MDNPLKILLIDDMPNVEEEVRKGLAKIGIRLKSITSALNLEISNSADVGCLIDKS